MLSSRGARPGSGRAPADPDDASAAEAVALRILTGAAQTEASLRRRLEQRGFSAAAARAAAVAAARHGYLDDDAFARSVGERRVRQGHGRAWVAAELRARGVGERPIEDLLRGLDPEAEEAAALALARRLAARTAARPGDDRSRWAMRIAQGLSRRGYDASIVRRVVHRVVVDEMASPDS